MEEAVIKRLENLKDHLEVYYRENKPGLVNSIMVFKIELLISNLEEYLKDLKINRENYITVLDGIIEKVKNGHFKEETPNEMIIIKPQ